MTRTAHDVIRSFFFDGNEAPATGDLAIDTLDSWTNSGFGVVNPTTISWSDSQAHTTA